MKGCRKMTTNYREILRLHSLGINKTRIAVGCGCSRTTVVTVLQRAAQLNISYPLPTDVTDKQLEDMLYPSGPEKPTYKMPAYEWVYKEMQRSGVTLNLLWLEYCDQCRQTGEIPYQSTQFNKYYHEYLRENNITMHISHKPGELGQVDWAGDRAHVVDTDTGELMDSYVFVASLPYSGYAYVEAFSSMNMESWITAHVNAFNYFGGVPRVVQCDNLRTGVDKHTSSEVHLNRTYQELAEHYGTAIIPCRVKRPRDKAHVERTVGIISTYIIAALRNRQFFSLRELNFAIREHLEQFNKKPFQKKDGSRTLMFEEEKPFLLPLPVNPYELATWKVATVQKNIHISIDWQNYSCPYEYAGQKVDVRLTKSTLEVFFQGNRICSHRRLYGRRDQYSTIEAHMPPNQQEYLSWNGDRFRKWAEKIGPDTAVVVEYFLTSHQVEQQGYKSCITLFKLADKYSIERLETACTRVLSFTTRPSLKSVQSILKSGQDKFVPKPETPIVSKSSSYGFTRGAGYYRKGD